MGVEVESAARSRALSFLINPFLHVLSLVVFGFFDLVDQLLCPVFLYLDWLLDRREGSCYCHGESSDFELGKERLPLSGARVVSDCEFWDGHSETLYSRKRKHGRSRVHFLALHRSLSAEAAEPLRFLNSRSAGRITGGNLLRNRFNSVSLDRGLASSVEKKLSVDSGVLPHGLSSEKSLFRHESPERSPLKARWSDCGCTTCTAWHTSEDLYVRLGGRGATESSCVDGDDSENNVIFIHGFLSSSSFWSETVFPEFSDSLKSTHRLFAVDVLGFGKSPKPTNCHYSNADHVEMIRKSVIDRYKLKKYHIVAHSMGCTIALSLAGQDPSAVRSVTLVSPPYYPAMPGSQPSSHILWKVAPRKIWPVFAFGPSFMSWYEHLGRVVCLVVCKNHRFWEPVMSFTLNKILRWRVPHFLVHDFMQHTHNTAWHIFHNTICSGAYTAEWSMKALEKAGKHVRVIHGDNDNICPLQCGLDLEKNYSNVSLSTIPGANHINILLGREKQMAQELEEEFCRL
ncbi:hypothetical protein M758_2G047600 [Ceratodon purpureus]|nr:hypothetical protein M758_2G047600 [Ceratodon purpureus]